MLSTLFVAVLSLLMQSALAAEITLAQPISRTLYTPFSKETIGEPLLPGSQIDFSRFHHIRLEGEIVAGDTERLLPLLSEADRFGNTLLSMNSQGGSYEEGLKLGDAIHSSSVSTYIDAGDECLSACAMAFMGGRVMELRDIVWSPSRYLHLKGKLGLHAPRIDGDVPAALLSKEAVAVLFEEFAQPTRQNIQELNARAVAWQISPDLLFEMLARVGAGEFFYIENGYDAIHNNITVVSDSARQPSNVGLMEAIQSCHTVLGVILLGQQDVRPADEYGLPHAHLFRDGMGEGSHGAPSEIEVGSDPAGNPVFRISRVYRGRGWLTCEIRKDANANWEVRPSGDLPTPAELPAQIQELGAYPLVAETMIGLGVPWSTLAKTDLFVAEADELYSNVPEPIRQRAKSLDYCTNPGPESWDLVCRFPVLHTSLRILGTLIEDSRETNPGSRLYLTKWGEEVVRLCRPHGIKNDDEVAVTMGGYCGLFVTHQMIRELIDTQPRAPGTP